MNDVIAFLLSPQGIALYAMFWIFKIVAGAWVLNKALLLLPVTVQTRARNGLALLRLRRARRLP